MPVDVPGALAIQTQIPPSTHRMPTIGVTGRAVQALVRTGPVPRRARNYASWKEATTVIASPALAANEDLPLRFPLELTLWESCSSLPRNIR